jgi:GcrA cell cycle regulator
MMMWTEERVALLRRLWLEGLSASEVARRLGGATRNSIMGKVHRLGLCGRAAAAVQAAKSATPRRRRPPRPRPPWLGALSAEPAPLAPLRCGDGRGVSVLALNASLCKFPIGDPSAADFAFCGRDAVGGPYCAFHAQLAYRGR